MTESAEASQSSVEIQKIAPDINIQVETVEGESFPVAVDATAQVDDLRAAVLASAPDHILEKGGTCFLAFMGKFLEDGSAYLRDIGITNGDFAMVVMQ